MGLKLSKVYKLVQKDYSKIEFTLDTDKKDVIEFSANVNSNNYDDGIRIEVTAYDDGTAHVFLIFDKIEPNFDNLRLVNEFNDNNSFYTASIKQINGNNYLELHGVCCAGYDEGDVAENVSFLISHVNSDSVVKELSELARRTIS